MTEFEHGMPLDGHVHSEWSWDASGGNMIDSCMEASRNGLPGLAFTEHIDLTPWHITPVVYDRLSPPYQEMVQPDNSLTPPLMDVDGYMEAIADCREQFPDLHILTGVEMGEVNWHRRQFEDLLSGQRFDRLLASSHSVKVDGEMIMIGDAISAATAPMDVLALYYEDLHRAVMECDFFEVLAHIDYPIRDWPEDVTFPFADVEERVRSVMEDLASTGRTLEFNTVLPMDALLLEWWVDVGGKRLAFGSDAHVAAHVGRGLREAARVAREYGFMEGPGGPLDIWTRA